MLTREGGHRADRIVHAGGDATGAEVQRALHAAVRRDPWIRLVEHALVLDLLRATPTAGPAGSPCTCSARAARTASARSWPARWCWPPAAWARSSRPPPTRSVSTGDGVALALRAGAAVTDVEFVQFHPTALVPAGGRTVPAPSSRWSPRRCAARAPTWSTRDGKRFMVGQHELAELAPARRGRQGHPPGAAGHRRGPRLPGRPAPGRRVPGRSGSRPSSASCLAAGVDPATDLIPVAPAAHYASGGVRTDLHGRTSIPGLYACGEVACTGVHGANRLASNSLLEGLVFSRRIAEDIAAGLPAQADPAATGAWPGGAGWVVAADGRARRCSGR